ncbi:MAG: ABC transporter permease [Opitutales bacterium]
MIITNLFRHRLRGLFGLAGIGFGVAAMLTVLAVVMGAISMFRNILESDSHFLVFEKNVSDLFFSSVTEEARLVIAGMPEVAAAHPVLFGIVASEERPVITCFGVQADNPRLLRAEWVSGVPEDFGKNPKSVYIGVRAAAFLKADMGDSIRIGKEQFVVGGILRTANGFEDGGVFLPLDQAQAFFRREGIASILSVNLRDISMGEAFRENVEDSFPDLAALANEEFSSNYSQFKILNATAWAVGFCAFLLGGMSVANTMTMSVFTRVREIAILRVSGFSRRQTALLIIGEALLLAMGGVIAGLSAGFLLLFGMQQAPFLQGYVSVAVPPSVVVAITVTAFTTSFLGSAYPAWYATRIQPAEALRYE